MFEKISHVAEKVVTKASRRQFLGQLGRVALSAAGAAAGFLATQQHAEAKPRYCSTGSTLSCAGKRPGDPCDNGVYGIGVCRQIGTGACGCYSK